MMRGSSEKWAIDDGIPILRIDEIISYICLSPSNHPYFNNTLAHRGICEIHSLYYFFRRVLLPNQKKKAVKFARSSIKHPSKSSCVSMCGFVCVCRIDENVISISSL